MYVYGRKDAANGLLTRAMYLMLRQQSLLCVPWCGLVVVPVMRLDSVIIEAAADSCRGRGELPRL